MSRKTIRIWKLEQNKGAEMNDTLQIVDANSGCQILTTKQLASRFGVSVSDVRLMRRIHGGIYRDFKSVKLANRLLWLPIDNNQPLEEIAMK